MRVMSTTIQQYFYRNGQLRMRVPLKNGRRHGRVRTWHTNGTLATEEPYFNGLAHGVFRQWDDKGRLLGRYKMVRGTGTHRAWHDNGRLQMELSTVNGELCGRSRMWLMDGTLISDRVHLFDRDATVAQYRRVATKDKRLPKLGGRIARLPAENRASRRHQFQVFVSWLLEKPCAEARTWLTASDGKRRNFGRFRPARQPLKSSAGKFVDALYQAGACEVLVADIYSDRAGNQFTDSILVKLPKERKLRAAVRKVAEQLSTRRLGAMQPDFDFGESHLFLSSS